jgi:hypothetical protein
MQYCNTMMCVNNHCNYSYSCHERVMACALIGEHQQAVDDTTGVAVVTLTTPGAAVHTPAAVQR